MLLTLMADKASDIMALSMCPVDICRWIIATTFQIKVPFMFSSRSALIFSHPRQEHLHFIA